MQRRTWTALWAAVLALTVVAASATESIAAHLKDNPKKHRIVYHFNGSDDGNHVKKANAVLQNMLNHVKGVGGWDNIEALVLVIHGDGVVPFIEKSMDPEVRRRFDLLTVSGMKLGV
jgi:intracellular sulfur oxidation DsrE/DsrF family protein